MNATIFSQYSNQIARASVLNVQKERAEKRVVFVVTLGDMHIVDPFKKRVQVISSRDPGIGSDELRIRSRS